MAIARSSVTQPQFEAEYSRIRRKRNIETGLLAGLDFISAVSTSLVIIDMVQLLGFEVSMLLALTASSLIFFGLLGVTLLCGVLCAIYMVQEGRYKRDAELSLMRHCFELATKQTCKLDKLKNSLSELLKIKNDAFIRERYERIMRNEDVNNAVREINGYIKNAMKPKLPALLQKKQKEDGLKVAEERARRPNYIISNIIAFFSGAGLMLGISASIIGASTLPALLLTPLGWGILAIVVLLTVAAGIAMAYMDYQLRQSQQTHIEALEKEEHALLSSNFYISKTNTRVEDYIASFPRKRESTSEEPEQHSTSSPDASPREIPASAGMTPSLEIPAEACPRMF